MFVNIWIVKGVKIMIIDFWYGNTKKDIAYYDCYFSDVDCIYRGNVYDKDRRPIGDFSGRNSVEIEKYFRG